MRVTAPQLVIPASAGDEEAAFRFGRVLWVSIVRALSCQRVISAKMLSVTFC